MAQSPGKGSLVRADFFLGECPRFGGGCPGPRWLLRHGLKLFCFMTCITQRSHNIRYTLRRRFWYIEQVEEAEAGSAGEQPARNTRPRLIVRCVTNGNPKGSRFAVCAVTIGDRSVCLRKLKPALPMSSAAAVPPHALECDENRSEVGLRLL